MPVGGAVDVAEGAPPPAPNGVTRIARIGGVLQQSSDGSVYQPLSAGMSPSTPSGPRPTAAGGVVDIPEGAVGTARNGVTRIARFGGVLMQSVDGSPWVALTASVAPSSPAAEGYGPGIAGLDLSEGQFAVSAPGVTRLARTGGVLATSTDGGPWTSIAPSSPVPPGNPGLWYDAQDINAGGAQPGDGAAISAWKNKGTLGAAWDLAQATGAAQPLFQAIATPGQIANRSSVKSTGTQWMATAVLSAQPVAAVCATVWRSDSVAASVFAYDGNTGGREGVNVFTGGIIQLSGAGTYNTTQTLSVSTWNALVVNYNTGATSFLRLNGIQGASGNCTPGGITGVTLFSFAGGGGIATGQIAEQLWYWDGTPVADIEAYLSARYGATPQ